MKPLYAISLFFWSNLVFGQAPAATIQKRDSIPQMYVSLHKDSIQQTVSINNSQHNNVDVKNIQHRDASYKGKNTIYQFVDANITPEMHKHIHKRKLNGYILFDALINTEGKLEIVRVKNGLDPYIDKTVGDILSQSEWEPAISEGKLVDRRVYIPIKINQ